MKKTFYSSFSIVAILALSLLTGCATIQKGTTQRVPIESQPSGAAVYVNNQYVGDTPLRHDFPRKTGHLVRIEKEGYASETLSLRTVPNEAAGAFVRFSVDEIVGAQNDLRPDAVSVSLRPDLLPAQKGADPFAEMKQTVGEVDRQLEEGEISAEEHEYLLSRVLEFYAE
ncbi:MAG: PEGA domain-containing protein [Opitutales bacterium]